MYVIITKSLALTIYNYLIEETRRKHINSSHTHKYKDKSSFDWPKDLLNNKGLEYDWPLFPN